MSMIVNISFGLVTTLVGYIIGRIWQRVLDQIPYRRARRFWASAVSGRLEIVVSRFTLDEFSEPTGIIGGGDALALRDLESFFRKMGVKKFEVTYVDEPGLNRENNLILLGGPGTNKVTRDALELVKSRFKIVDPGPGSPIEINDLAPTPDAQMVSTGVVASTPSRYFASKDIDYGIIIRARNPFNRRKGVIIIAGAYGYGTWGGVRLALDEGFLERCAEFEVAATPSPVEPRRLYRKTFERVARILGAPGRYSLQLQPQLECLLRVRVYDGRPYTPEIVLLRGLPDAAGGAHSPDSSRSGSNVA
jgi:hypothetical protein